MADTSFSTKEKVAMIVVSIPIFTVGMLFGHDTTPEPKVITKTKVVREPAPEPEVITKIETEWKEVHVVEPLPKSCSRIPDVIQAWMDHANKVNYLGNQVYTEIQDSWYSVFTSPGSATAVRDRLHSLLERQSIPLRQSFDGSQELKSLYAACKADVEAVNSGD